MYEPISTGNPVLDKVPAIPSLARAREVFRQSFGATPEGLEILRRSQGENLYRPIVSLKAQEDLLQKVVAQVRAGFTGRNLLAPGNGELFRHSLATARQAPNVQGHRGARDVVTIKGARPRGIVFVTTARMGRRVTAERITEFLGQNPVPIEIATPGGRVTHWHLPVLRVNWAGRLDDFIGKFLSAYGAAMRQGELLKDVRIDKGRLEAEALAIMVGFSLGANLGLLIIERINTTAAEPVSAVQVWSLLGEFTRATGIPVLSMATTGATLGLMRDASASGELSGTVIPMSPPDVHSAAWHEVCTYAYQAVLGGTGAPPSWLVAQLGDKTQARISLAFKCCIALAHYGQGDEFWAKHPPDFGKIVETALYTEQAALMNAKRLANGGKGYTRGSVLRFADWLAPQAGPEQALGLRIEAMRIPNRPPEVQD